MSSSKHEGTGENVYAHMSARDIIVGNAFPMWTKQL